MFADKIIVCLLFVVLFVSVLSVAARRWLVFFYELIFMKERVEEGKRHILKMWQIARPVIRKTTKSKSPSKSYHFLGYKAGIVGA